MEEGVSLSNIRMKGTMRRLIKERATTTQNLLQASGLPPQADTSSHEPIAVRGDCTKTRTIPHKQSKQASVDRHHTCSMGVRTTVKLLLQKRSSATSEGRVQERLLQPLCGGPPRSNRKLLKLHQSLRNNYKIEHEHRINFSTHHHKETNSCKKA
jgi:hypothetical protein